MNDFVAIDFETANPDHTSACAVGLAIVRGGIVQDTYSTLIRPPTLEFSHWNRMVHRIKPSQVADKPSFAEVWPALAKRIEGLPLLAHNASFDRGVMEACQQRYGIPQIASEWFCTLAMARHVLPGLPNHKLGTLARLFGIGLMHHDAGADALACAELAVRLIRVIGGDGVGQFLNRHSDPPLDSGYSPPDGKPFAVHVDLGSPMDSADAVDDEDNSEVIDLVEPAEPDGRFTGVRFAFTGELATMSREEAEALVEQQGGEAGHCVAWKTKYVVVGDDVLQRFHAEGDTTGKLARAVELREQGSELEIIDESTFLEMVRSPSPMAAPMPVNTPVVSAEPTASPTPAAGGLLAGKTIVVTGSLENYTRSQIKNEIEAHGGTASESVSKATSFVLAGADPGSKLDKAKKLGVEVIDETEFRQRIGIA